MLDCGCPERYPEDWHGRDIDLSGHCVMRLDIPTPIHMPVAIEAYLQRQQRSIEELQLSEDWPNLVLVRTGLWRGEILRLLKDEGSMSRLVGYLPHPFHARAHLHHGNVSTLRSSLRRIQQSLFDEGKMPKDLYLSHLTCPRCRDKRGGDLILVLRRWQESPTLKQRLAKQQQKTKKSS